MTEEIEPPTPEEIARHRNIMNIVDVTLKRPKREYSDEEVMKDLTSPNEDTGGTLLNGSRNLRTLLTAFKEKYGTLTPR